MSRMDLTTEIAGDVIKQRPMGARLADKRIAQVSSQRTAEVVVWHLGSVGKAYQCSGCSWIIQH